MIPYKERVLDVGGMGFCEYTIDHIKGEATYFWRNTSTWPLLVVLDFQLLRPSITLPTKQL